MQITIVNDVFLKNLHKFNGETNFGLSQVPDSVASILSTVDSLHNGGRINSTRFFGFVKRNVLDQWAIELAFPEGYSNLGFGNWLNEEDTYYKREIIEHRNSRDFDVTEIRGLMTALSNDELLGVTYPILSNVSFPHKCLMPTADMALSISSAEGLNNEMKETCRLTSCLYQLENYISGLPNVQVSSPALTSVLQCIATYLCTDTRTTCLPFPAGNTLRLAYAHAVHDYIFHHLAQYVFHSTVILQNNDLIASKSQRSLALGYYENITSDSQVFESNFVPGILEHALSIKDPRWFIIRRQIQLYNCYDAVNAQTNFMWRGKAAGNEQVGWNFKL